MLSQIPDFMDSLIGLYMCGVGLLMIIIGSHTKRKLMTIQAYMKDEDMVKEIFDQADLDKSSKLSKLELVKICEVLGSPLEMLELEAAMQMLDKNGDDQISFDEFID